MENGAPGKERRAGVAWISEGFRLGGCPQWSERREPRRNGPAGWCGLKDGWFAFQLVASALGPA